MTSDTSEDRWQNSLAPLVITTLGYPPGTHLLRIHRVTVDSRGGGGYIARCLRGTRIGMAVASKSIAQDVRDLCHPVPHELVQPYSSLWRHPLILWSRILRRLSLHVSLTTSMCIPTLKPYAMLHIFIISCWMYHDLAAAQSATVPR